MPKVRCTSNKATFLFWPVVHFLCLVSTGVVTECLLCHETDLANSLRHALVFRQGSFPTFPTRFPDRHQDPRSHVKLVEERFPVRERVGLG